MQYDAHDNAAVYPGINKPDKIIVHHSASIYTQDQFEAINTYHKDQGFPLSNMGFYVGYQYLINGDGIVKQCREDLEGGAHTIGQNFTSIGICLEGEFDTGSPSPAQYKALYELCRKLCETHQIVPSEIFPHRKYAQKSCYGAALDDNYAVKCVIIQWIADLEGQVSSLAGQIKA